MLIEQNLCLPKHLQEISFLTSDLEKTIKKKLKTAIAIVEENCGLKNHKEELALIEEIANKIHANYNQAIIIGIGGAISASRTYTGCYNYQTSKFKLLYSDSISIEKQNNIFTKDNLNNSAIIVISRSGESIETLTQTHNAIDKYQQYFGKKYNLGNHFFIITHGSNTLSNLGESIGANIFNYVSKSGKFSTFSMAGLLPARLINLQPKKIMNGAFKALKESNSIIEPAWVNFQLIQLGYNINVLSNYDDRFKEVLNWYNQISCEITAKNGKGSTSIVAGISDQHGLWQLFIAGPNDKYFTLLWDKQPEKTSKHTQLTKETYFKLNKKGLIKKKAPIREIIITKPNDESLGFLMMQLLLETVLLANFLDVSAITHPEIEKQKKILNRVYFSSFKKNSIN